MSEFSESYHFRVDAALPETELVAALGQSEIHGVLYPGGGAWRTFAPIDEWVGEEPHLTYGARLSRALRQPILEYRFVEDYFWSFTIWNGDEVSSSYACEWTTGKPVIDDSMLQLPPLSALGVPQHELGRLAEVLSPKRGLLTPKRRLLEQSLGAAGIFARTMGLEHFEHVGPASLEIDLPELAASSSHTIIGGSNPSSAPSSPQVIAVQALSYPTEFGTTQLTARDAVAASTAYSHEWGPDARLVLMHSVPIPDPNPSASAPGPWIGANGRTTEFGGWVMYRQSLTETRSVKLTVFPSVGRTVVAHVEAKIVPNANADDVAWLDSPSVLAITDPLYFASGIAQSTELYDRTMQLAITAEATIWLVYYVCFVGPISENRREDFRVTIHAVTGQVLKSERVVV